MTFLQYITKKPYSKPNPKPNFFGEKKVTNYQTLSDIINKDISDKEKIKLKKQKTEFKKYIFRKTKKQKN